METSTATRVPVRATLLGVSKQDLSRAEMERVRSLLKDLEAKAGTQSRLAEQMGVSQQHVSKALGGGEFGLAFARRVVEYAGISRPLAWIEGAEAARPVLQNLPGFDEALRVARKREPFFPPFAWRDAASTSPLVAPPSVDADMLIYAARLAISLRSASEIETAEGERVDDEEAKRNDRQVEGEKRVAEAKARGEKLSLSKAMAQIRRERGE